MPGIEQFGIRYTSKGFDRVHRQQNALTRSGKRLAQSTRGAGSAMNGFAGHVKSLIAVGTITLLTHRIISLSDSFINMQNRLNVSAESTDEMTRSLGALFEISKKTRTEVATNTEIFSRFALAGRVQGFNTNQLLVATEALAKSVVISGATTSEAQGAFIQLSQAFGSTELRGQELTSVLEQIPRAAQAIAEALDIPIGKLREFGIEGKITSRDILRALINSADKLDQEFNQTTSTFAQALVVLQNELRLFIGAAGEASGLIEGLVSTANFLATDVTPVLGEALVRVGQIVADIKQSFDAIQSVGDGAGSALGRFSVNAVNFLTDAADAASNLIAVLSGTADLTIPRGFRDGPASQVTSILNALDQLDDTTRNEGIASLDRLNELVRKGAISADAYSKGLEDLRERFVGLAKGVKTATPTIEEQRQALKEAEEGMQGLRGTAATVARSFKDVFGFPLLDEIFPTVKLGLAISEGLEQPLNEAEKAANDFNKAIAPVSALDRYRAKMAAVEEARKEVQRGIEAMPPGIVRLNLALNKTTRDGFQKIIDSMDKAGAVARNFQEELKLLNQVVESGGRQGTIRQFGFDPGRGTSATGPGNPLGLPPPEQIEFLIKRYQSIVETEFGGLAGQISSALGDVDESFDLKSKSQELNSFVDEFLVLPDAIRRNLPNGGLLSEMLTALGPDQFRATVLKSLDDVKKDTRDFAQEVSRIFFNIDPVRGATFEIQEQIALLTKALNGGVPGLNEYGVSTGDLSRALEELSTKLNDPVGKLVELNQEVQSYRDVAFPAQAASRELAEQIEAINKWVAAADNSLVGYERSLSGAAIITELTRQNTNDMNRELIALQEQFRNLSVDPMEELNELLRAGKIAFEEGSISAERFARSEAEVKRQSDDLSRSFDAGVRRSLQGLVDEYTNGAAQIEGTVVNAFRGAEDALVDFVQTGKLNFTDLVNSIIADLARLAIQRAILAPLIGAIFPGGEATTSIATSAVGGAAAIAPSVGGSASSFEAASNGTEQITIAPQVTVQVDARGSNDPQAVGDETAKAVQKAVETQTRALVRDEIQRMNRPGGQLNRRLQSGV